MVVLRDAEHEDISNTHTDIDNLQRLNVRVYDVHRDVELQGVGEEDGQGHHQLGHSRQANKKHIVRT